MEEISFEFVCKLLIILGSLFLDNKNLIDFSFSFAFA